MVQFPGLERVMGFVDRHRFKSLDSSKKQKHSQKVVSQHANY